MIAVLAPVLRRPERVVPFVDRFTVCDHGTDARLELLCSRGDVAEIAACQQAADIHDQVTARVLPGPWRPGDWARKLNWAMSDAPDEWFLLGADDLVFHPGWAAAVMRAHDRSQACVVGTNDTANPRVVRGQHSTHPAVHRDYRECGTADQAGIVLHEGYGHQFVDDELVQTARVRGTFAFAHDAIVEHHHPDWGTADRDATYDLGQSMFDRDRTLFLQRQPLWLGG